MIVQGVLLLIFFSWVKVSSATESPIYVLNQIYPGEVAFLRINKDTMEGNIWSKNLKTGKEKQITSGTRILSYDISKDGRLLCYWKSSLPPHLLRLADPLSQKSELWITDLISKRSVLLLKSDSWHINCALSPKGDKVVYTTYLPEPEPKEEVIEIDIETGAKRKVLKIPHTFWQRRISYSPDGNFILLIKSTSWGLKERVYVANIKNGEFKRIFGWWLLISTAPCWSPDGKKIASAIYGITDLIQERRITPIAIVDSLTKRMLYKIPLIIKSKHQSFCPSILEWKDENKILFVFGDEFRRDIYELDIITKEIKLVIEDGDQPRFIHLKER
jgi:Tol biopolymer transport system component